MPKKLALLSQDQGVVYKFNHERIHIDQEEGIYKLYFKDQEPIKAKKIILTCTPSALLKLLGSSPVFQTSDFSKLNVHLSNPLTKLFFVYPNSWWTKLSLFSGSSTTTLPLRSPYYLGEEEKRNAWLLASYQGSYTPFWSSAAKKSDAQQKKDYVPGEIAIRLGQKYVKQERGVQDIPEPILALFMDWMQAPHYGAYFFWQIGVISEEWILEFMELRKNIFLAGSPYSTHTGWVEGGKL